MSPTVTEAIPAALQSAAATVERALAERLARADLPENLRRAVEYAALDGGKRLRPTLTLLCCDAVGGDRSAALAPAVAIELIHCFSLVHDDLPAMDDDALRRGRPTLHVRAGEAMAILAGDVMVALAFSDLSRPGGAPPETRLRLLAELTEGTVRMIAGQVYDTLGGFPEGLEPGGRLELIHRSKTGALIRVACRLGAIAGGADDTALAAVTRYGESIGLMFQIVDDLLDVTQSTEHLGKAAGKDERAGKLTWPGVFGVEAARAEVERLRQEAHAALCDLGPATGPLEALGDFMAVRTR